MPELKVETGITPDTSFLIHFLSHVAPRWAVRLLSASTWLCPNGVANAQIHDSWLNRAETLRNRPPHGAKGCISLQCDTFQHVSQFLIHPETSPSSVFLSPHLTRSISSRFQWTHLFYSRTQQVNSINCQCRTKSSSSPAFDKNLSSGKLVAGERKAKEIRFKWNIPRLGKKKRRNEIRRKKLLPHPCSLIVFFTAGLSDVRLWWCSQLNQQFSAFPLRPWNWT